MSLIDSLCQRRVQLDLETAALQVKREQLEQEEKEKEAQSASLPAVVSVPVVAAADTVQINQVEFVLGAPDYEVFETCPLQCVTTFKLKDDGSHQQAIEWEPTVIINQKVLDYTSKCPASLKPFSVVLFIGDVRSALSLDVLWYKPDTCSPPHILLEGRLGSSTMVNIEFDYDDSRRSLAFRQLSLHD